MPPYRSQSIDLQSKSINWFLCDGNFGVFLKDWNLQFKIDKTKSKTLNVKEHGESENAYLERLKKLFSSCYFLKNFLSIDEWCYCPTRFCLKTFLTASLMRNHCILILGFFPLYFEDIIFLISYLRKIFRLILGSLTIWEYRYKMSGNNYFLWEYTDRIFY